MPKQKNFIMKGFLTFQLILNQMFIRVPLSLGRVIQQARQAKEMTQKDLATKINEKVEVLREYENAKVRIFLF